MNKGRKPLVRLFVVGLLTWLTIGTGLWILGGPTQGAAIEAAILCTGATAGLVWWISGRVPRVSTGWVAVVGVHALVALLFGSLMISVTYSLAASAAGTTLREGLAAARFLGAEFLFWVWLYAVLAAGSHGARIREAVRDEREHRARSEARLAEARLQALQGQLNPHFLFNALHTVRALVQHDPDRAAAAVEMLGDLLRYSLDDASTGTVEFADEVRFTRTYLDLMNLAIGDRLRVSISIDEEAMGHPVPPFSLQCLVENAVRHGVLPRPEGGNVEVTVHGEPGGVGIIVENDCDPSGPGTRSPAKIGRGLGNLEARLAALYGTGAELVAEHDGPGRFAARIHVPGR